MPTATVRTAALTGAFAGLVGLLLGRFVDVPGSGGTLWLLLAVVVVGLPGYYFVFGITKAEMVGPWALQPALLKRVAACIIGAVAVATLAWPLFSLLPS